MLPCTSIPPCSIASRALFGLAFLQNQPVGVRRTILLCSMLYSIHVWETARVWPPPSPLPDYRCNEIGYYCLYYWSGLVSKVFTAVYSDQEITQNSSAMPGRYIGGLLINPLLRNMCGAVVVNFPGWADANGMHIKQISLPSIYDPALSAAIIILAVTCQTFIKIFIVNMDDGLWYCCPNLLSRA